MSRIFGNSRQVGIVVRDIDAAMASMAETLGVGPFLVIREAVPDWFRYRGEASESPVMSMAFAYSGDLQLEIIQQHNDAPSAYKDFLDRGLSGVQHLSSWADSPEDYNQMRAAALAANPVIVHEGQIGPARFAYFDTVDTHFGLCFEISEAMIPEYRPIWTDLQAASVGWDGSGLVRTLD